MSENKSNKYLSFVKNELSGQFDDLRIVSAEKIAESSSATYSWIIIGIVGFFTYISFLLWAPLFFAWLWVALFSTQGNAILVGYTAVFLLHLLLLLFLLIFRKSLLQRSVYNKVFETVFNIGNK